MRYLNIPKMKKRNYLSLDTKYIKRTRKKFDNILPTLTNRLAGKKCTSKSEVIKIAREIGEILTKTSDAAIPRKGRRKVGRKWWGPELTNLKRQVYRI